jgi:ABC-type multidrug transport system permease subunit
LARVVAPPWPTLKIVGMKKIALATGIVLSFIGGIQGSRYFLDYSLLTQYGKGFVWGSVVLFLIGIVLIYFGLRKVKTSV